MGAGPVPLAVVAAATPVRVLLAEADPQSSAQTQRHLRALGHAVAAVATAADALTRAGEWRAELVLMAGELDDATAQRVRDQFAIPVIRLLDAPPPGGPLAYVLRPTTPRELSLVIEATVHRRRSERALAGERRRLGAVLRSMADGVLTTDAHDRVTYLNPAAEALTEWANDEARGSRFDEVVALLDERTRRPIELPAGEAVAATGLRSLGESLILVTRSGREVPISDSVAPILEDAGGRLGTVFVFRDAAEKRAVVREATKLAAIVACSIDGVMGFTADGTVTSWNPAAERILGYRPDEIIGRKIFQLAAPGEEEAMRERTARLVASGASLSVEGVRRHKDGRLIQVGVDLFAIRGGEAGYAAIFRDVSHLRQLQEQFRQAQKMESIGLLASGVAHDFNNLLTVIGGYSQLLMEDLPSNDRTRETVQEIRAAGERAANLTRQLLAFSRKQVLAPVVLDLNAVVGQSVRMFERLIGADVALRFVPDPRLRPIRADLGQIEQVLMNLTVNARDAMPGGGTLTITTANETVTEGAEPRPGEYVRLSVTDTGCGIPPDVLARVFEPFFTTKGADRGTGLGLAMVYGFVTQSGGHIAVASTVGAGTTFHIRLPALDAAAAGPAAVPEADVLVGRSSETILLVEDDLSVRQFVGIALRGQGYEVLEAGDGAEALRVAAEYAGPIALLMTDVVMPEMGGRQLADALRQVRPGIKILFVSGYLDDVIARLDGMTAADNFLHKPFSPIVLAQKVRAVIDAVAP